MNSPKTFLVGKTFPVWDAINDYLAHTGQTDFIDDCVQASDDGIPSSMQMVSMFAKMCYKSLVPGKNKNVSKTRSIKDNICSVVESGHGSVLEHVTFNFITTGCSRVFTHELVRHRVGTAFSQTSGRYCALDEDSYIVDDDPILPFHIRDEMQEMLKENVKTIDRWRRMMAADEMSFADKKKLTSALRRIAPSGLANEIAWSANLRQLRHMIEMRTSVHAEWEIRHVFNEVASMLEPEGFLVGGSFNADTHEWTGLQI